MNCRVAQKPGSVEQHESLHRELSTQPDSRFTMSTLFRSHLNLRSVNTGLLNHMFLTVQAQVKPGKPTAFASSLHTHLILILHWCCTICTFLIQKVHAPSPSPICFSPTPAYRSIWEAKQTISYPEVQCAKPSALETDPGVTTPHGTSEVALPYYDMPHTNSTIRDKPIETLNLKFFHHHSMASSTA